MMTFAAAESVVLVMQYKLHESSDDLAPSLPSDASLGACGDDTVDIDMEKLKAEAKEVRLLRMWLTLK